MFLASLKAGGVGMNLTAADAVHILEPWWNSSVEEQAADRVHRLGQRRPVSIYRCAVTQHCTGLAGFQAGSRRAPSTRRTTVAVSGSPPLVMLGVTNV